MKCGTMANSQADVLVVVARWRRALRGEVPMRSHLPARVANAVTLLVSALLGAQATWCALDDTPSSASPDCTMNGAKTNRFNKKGSGA